MNIYERYIPSGIDWIGEVPQAWRIKRIKNVAQIVNGSTPSSSSDEYWDGEIIWVTPADFNKFDKYLNDSENKITESGYNSCGTSLVPVGSIILTTRAPIGNVLIAGAQLCTNQGCKSLVPYQIESRFLFYVLSIVSIELNVLGNGTTFLELSKESLGTFNIPLPSLTEQLSIANYLDDQTQNIDRLIANKKAQVEKLKELRQIEINNAVTKGLNPDVELKDSGIDWLGKVPTHWKTNRVKNICKIINGSTPSSSIDSYWDGDIIWVTPGDFRNHEHTINDSNSKITKEGYINCGTSLVPIGSIILTTRAPIGNVLIASKKLCTNQGCKSLIPININSEFLYYCFSVSSIQLNSIGQGTTFLELSTINLGTFIVPFPPIKEQIQIAKYLEQRTTAIDQLIKNVEAQIEKLQELRKIKIYEAVTGKIKVPDYAEATA